MFKVIVGPVKASKSKALINRAEEEDTVLFSSELALENGKKIRSRCGSEISSTPITSISEIIPSIYDNRVRTILVDEIQFINITIVALDTVSSLIEEHNKTLIVYGLDLDYKGLPFTSTALCMSYADKVIKVNGICEECGMPSTMSVRCSDGKPVDITEHADLVSLDNTGNITYKTVCRKCYNKIYNVINR